MADMAGSEETSSIRRVRRDVDFAGLPIVVKRGRKGIAEFGGIAG